MKIRLWKVAVAIASDFKKGACGMGSEDGE
jgi:hypothetical protein